MGEERGDGVAAQVGTDGDGPGSDHREGGRGVGPRFGWAGGAGGGGGGVAPQRFGARRRRVPGARIEPDAEHRVGPGHPVAQQGEEPGHALPSTMASSAIRTYMPYSIWREED